VEAKPFAAKVPKRTARVEKDDRSAQLRNLDVWVESLRKLCSEGRELSAGVDEGAFEVCSAAVEPKKENRRAREHVVTAFSQGLMLASASRDLGEALVRTLEEPILTVGPWSMGRSCLENCALGVWLLDPTLDSQTRATRSLAFRFSGVDQQRKFLNATGSRKKAEICEKRIDHLVSSAAKLNVEAVIDNKGRVAGIGKRMPAATDLVSDYLDSQGAYRLLSAMVHGHSWAHQQLAFVPVLDENGEPVESEKQSVVMRSLRKGLRPAAVKYLLVETGRGIWTLHKTVCTLFGLECQALEGAWLELEKSLRGPT